MKHDVSPAVTLIGVGALVAIAIIAAVAKSAKNEERKKRIYAKYGKTELADRLAQQVIWTGETVEQLRDSLGDPVDVAQHVLKTKKREVWKYDRQGENRYGWRITIEDGAVVGWDHK